MRTDEILIPADSSGAAYRLTMLRFGKSEARPRVYIQAALHADEIPGMAAAMVLRRKLDEAEGRGRISGEIILVPVANPIGLAQRVLGQDVGRFDLSDGGNFNRDYPALGPALVERMIGELKDDAPTNIRLTRAAMRDLLRERTVFTASDRLKASLLGEALMADLVLDLHCDSEAVMHAYTHTRSAETFAPLAARLGAEAYLLAEISGGEPFDEALSRPWVELATAMPGKPVPFACQSITVELRGQRDVSPDFAEADAAAIYDFLCDAGAIDEVPSPLPPARCHPTPLAASEPLIAPVPGVLFYHRKTGEPVAQGEMIAEIVDPVTSVSTSVLAPCDGVFFARSASRYALPGRRLGKVAGLEARRTGKLLSP